MFAPLTPVRLGEFKTFCVYTIGRLTPNCLSDLVCVVGRQMVLGWNFTHLLFFILSGFLSLFVISHELCVFCVKYVPGTKTLCSPSNKFHEMKYNCK